MDAEYWTRTFDAVAAGYDEAQSLDVLRKGTIEQVRRDINEKRVPAPTLTLDQRLRVEFDRAVIPERDRRSNNLNRDLSYLLDGFTEDGTYVDPVLSQAHRLGDATDKVLRLWTRDDWFMWAHRRLAAAAKSSAAAHESDNLAERMIGRMAAAGVDFTGDLWADGEE